MEELAIALLQLFVELFGQILVEIVWEFGTSGYKARNERPNHNVVLAVLGYFVAGATLGAFSLLVWPGRIFPPGPLPGLSLVLSPLCAGAAMHAWGDYRRRRGHVTTNLATFLGGAAFALGTALVRFLLVR